MKISVLVITYNSEKWILETLDSIKNQTFKNIELIISDDFSKDNTLSKCEEWKKLNKNRFVDIKIRASSKNLGIVRNINEGIKLSTCKWIKIIAGDDLLKNKCIESNINYALKNKCKVIFSHAQIFKNEFRVRNYIPNKIKNDDFFKKDSSEQFKILLRECKLLAPTAFFNNDILKKVGYFNEEYSMVEDYPMWLKLTKNGIKLDFLDKKTVFYRIHENSISNVNNIIINKKMFEFRKEIYKKEIKAEMKNLIDHYSEKLMHMKYENIIKNGNKKKTIIYYILTLLDPYTYIKRLKNLRRRYEKI